LFVEKRLVRSRVCFMKKILFSLVALVLFFAAAEVLARVALMAQLRMTYGVEVGLSGDARLGPEPDLGWAWPEGKTFRGHPDPGAEKPAGLFRIITTGDSCCFGSGVKAWETFSARLETLLRDRFGEGRVEVLNAGVPGYSIRQVLELTQSRLLDFEPDVIIRYGTGPGRTRTDRGLGLPLSGYTGPIEDLLFHSTAYLFAHQAWRSLRGRPSEEPLEQEYSETRRLKELVRGHGVKLVLVEYLVNDFGVFHSPIAGRELESDVPIVRTYERFVRTGLAMEDLMFDRVHPTAVGHAIIGRAIYETFLEKTIIPDVPPSPSP